MMKAIFKTVPVSLPPEQALRLFIEDMSKWWPLNTEPLWAQTIGTG
jgi:hypothetical protein